MLFRRNSEKEVAALVSERGAEAARRLRKLDVVRVWWPRQRTWFQGHVTDFRLAIGKHHSHSVREFHVLYDDGDKAWVSPLSTPFEVLDDERPVASEWLELELRCKLSLARLTDPAKCSSCEHPAYFEFQALNQHNGPWCPAPGCDSRFKRREVQRDDWLRSLLAPVSASTVWIRGEGASLELRTEPPGQPSVQDAAKGGRKRGRSGSVQAEDCDDHSGPGPSGVRVKIE